jgi:peptidoglycan/LPS O-acetylase OafA/YrhL
MVVFIHIVQQLHRYYDGIGWISDWFNLGLVMFFVMSAFLYSKRTIREGKIKWFFHRYLELIIPSLFAVVATLIVYQAIYGGIAPARAFSSVLSGLGLEAFVSDSWMFIQYWFITYILVCYLTIPLIQKIQFKAMTELKFWSFLIAVTILIQGILSAVSMVTSIPTLSWGVLLRFYLPYAMYKRYDAETIHKPMTVLTILSLGCIAVVCVIRYLCAFDGILASLSELAFIYTQTLAGTVLFYWLYQLFSYVKEHKKLIQITDRYSYPVYLTHCLFIGYSTSVIGRFSNHLIGVLAALGCTAVASVIVLKVTTPMRKWVSGKLA